MAKETNTKTKALTTQTASPATGLHNVFKKVAGVTVEIAQPSAKAFVKLAPKLAVAGLAGLEALPFVVAATVAGAAIGVGLQHLSRHQQAAANKKAKSASPRG